MPKDRAYIFRRFEALKDLSQAALDDLARSCTWQHVTPGRQIIRANDETNDVYFITGNKVKVLLYAADDGQPVVFAKLGPYEMFGEVAAIDGQARSATVESDGEGDIAVLKRDKFLRLMHDHPDFAMAVLLQMAAQVRRLTIRVFEYDALDVHNRVQAELLRLAIPDPCHENQALISPAPRAEVAAKTGTAREAVSRVISKLDGEGILRREGQDLRILDVKRLKDRVSAAKGE